jgi:hypothetical protein
MFSRTQLGAQRGGEVAWIPGDDLTGIGPDRIAVREVVGPHAVVGAPPGQYVPADGVVEESGVDLLVEVFAADFLDCQALAWRRSV